MDIFHMDNNICNPKEASKWTQSPYGDQPTEYIKCRFNFVFLNIHAFLLFIFQWLRNACLGNLWSLVCSRKVVLAEWQLDAPGFSALSPGQLSVCFTTSPPSPLHLYSFSPFLCFLFFSFISLRPFCLTVSYSSFIGFWPPF